MGDPRISPVVVDSLTRLLSRLLRFEGPADATMSRHFKAESRLGPRERSLVAECAFDALRRLATLRWMMQTADPLRAPHLAALIEVARVHGIDSLGSRLLRGDERAVRGALSIDLGLAPPAVRAEVPMWLFQRVTVQYHDAQQLLESLTQAAPLDLRVNTIKADRAAVLAEFKSIARANGALDAVATRYSPDGVRLREKPALKRWPMYKDGRIEVQDEGSQLVARALTLADLDGPDAGRWLDLCSGPGGKTALLAALADGAQVTAVEPAERRAEMVEQNTRGLPVEVLRVDGRDPGLEPGFDRVLVDAPCTGLGALRRRPEARWRRRPDDLAGLVRLQRELLVAALRMLRPGGVVAYVTCSPYLDETLGVVADVVRRTGAEQLDARPQFPGVPRLGEGPHVQLWPHRHGTDAMFCALLRR